MTLSWSESGYFDWNPWTRVVTITPVTTSICVPSVGIISESSPKIPSLCGIRRAANTPQGQSHQPTYEIVTLEHVLIHISRVPQQSGLRGLKAAPLPLNTKTRCSSICHTALTAIVAKAQGLRLRSTYTMRMRARRCAILQGAPFSLFFLFISPRFFSPLYCRYFFMHLSRIR